MDETFDQMVQDLVCQLCEGYPNPDDERWYKCSDHHHICQSCVESEKMEKCSCQENILKKVDKMTEMLLKMENLKFKCCYCSASFVRGDKNAHNSGCDKRFVPCLYADYNEPYKCTAMVRLDYILDHFESMHREQIRTLKNGKTYVSTVLEPKANLIRNKLSTIPRKIEAFGKYFIRTACERNGVLYEWIRLIGSPSEAENYLFSLEYKGSASTHVYLGKVASIDETLESIITSGKCSSIGFETFVHQFLDGTASELKITSNITIKKHDE